MEQLKFRLEGLKEKIIDVEEAVENHYDTEKMEVELRNLEEEIESFRFFLEERLY